jgi:phosphoglucomutase
MEGSAISAHFRHTDSLIGVALPHIICSVCVAQITASLSKESRKVWQDFNSRHFGGPDSEDIESGDFLITSCSSPGTSEVPPHPRKSWLLRK